VLSLTWEARQNTASEYKFYIGDRLTDEMKDVSINKGTERLPGLQLTLMKALRKNEQVVALPLTSRV
jgi:hypothetical protein